MPLVVLQQFPCPPPGQRLKHEKGWTYVERRPGHRTKLCRTTRSRAPSPERSEENHHWHNHYDRCCPSPEPYIITRSPDSTCPKPAPRPAPRPLSPKPPAPTPAPAPPPPTPAPSSPKITKLQASLIAAYEASAKAQRDAEARKERIENKLRSAMSPPPPSYHSRPRDRARDCQEHDRFQREKDRLARELREREQRRREQHDRDRRELEMLQREKWRREKEERERREREREQCRREQRRREDREREKRECEKRERERWEWREYQREREREREREWERQRRRYPAIPYYYPTYYYPTYRYPCA